MNVWEKLIRKTIREFTRSQNLTIKRLRLKDLDRQVGRAVAEAGGADWRTHAVFISLEDAALIKELLGDFRYASDGSRRSEIDYQAVARVRNGGPFIYAKPELNPGDVQIGSWSKPETWRDRPPML